MNNHKNAPLRKRAIAAAVLTLASSALTAQTVTVSGIADAAARNVKNTGGSSVKSLVSGSNSTSRIIIRGVEDLGGGLTAGFHLEHGILLDAGAAVSATQFWDRRSTVSVTSPEWGELRLGRDFVPSYVSWTRYDPFSYVGSRRFQQPGVCNAERADPLGVLDLAEHDRALQQRDPVAHAERLGRDRGRP
jgi:predicted porin